MAEDDEFNAAHGDVSVLECPSSVKIQQFVGKRAYGGMPFLMYNSIVEWLEMGREEWFPPWVTTSTQERTWRVMSRLYGLRGDGLLAHRGKVVVLCTESESLLKELHLRLGHATAGALHTSVARFFTFVSYGGMKGDCVLTCSECPQCSKIGPRPLISQKASIWNEFQIEIVPCEVKSSQHGRRFNVCVTGIEEENVIEHNQLVDGLIDEHLEQSTSSQFYHLRSRSRIYRENYKRIVHYLRTGEILDKIFMKNSNEMGGFVRRCSLFELAKDGQTVVWKKKDRKPALILEEEVAVLMKEAHVKLGHTSGDNLLRVLQKSVFWLGMFDDVRRVACEVCGPRDLSRTKISVPVLELDEECTLSIRFEYPEETGDRALFVDWGTLDKDEVIAHNSKLARHLRKGGTGTFRNTFHDNETPCVPVKRIRIPPPRRLKKTVKKEETGTDCRPPLLKISPFDIHKDESDRWDSGANRMDPIGTHDRGVHMESLTDDLIADHNVEMKPDVSTSGFLLPMDCNHANVSNTLTEHNFENKPQLLHAAQKGFGGMPVHVHAALVSYVLSGKRIYPSWVRTCEDRSTFRRMGAAFDLRDGLLVHREKIVLLEDESQTIIAEIHQKLGHCSKQVLKMFLGKYFTYVSYGSCKRDATRVFSECFCTESAISQRFYFSEESGVVLDIRASSEGNRRLDVDIRGVDQAKIAQHNEKQAAHMGTSSRGLCYNDFSISIDSYFLIEKYLRTRKIDESRFQTESQARIFQKRCSHFRLAADKKTILWKNKEGTPMLICKEEVPALGLRVHEMLGHPGVTLTMNLIKRDVNWANMRDGLLDIECPQCGPKTKATLVNPLLKPPLQKDWRLKFGAKYKKDTRELTIDWGSVDQKKILDHCDVIHRYRQRFKEGKQRAIPRSMVTHHQELLTGGIRNEELHLIMPDVKPADGRKAASCAETLKQIPKRRRGRKKNATSRKKKKAAVVQSRRKKNIQKDVLSEVEIDRLEKTYEWETRQIMDCPLRSKEEFLAEIDRLVGESVKEEEWTDDQHLTNVENGDL